MHPNDNSIWFTDPGCGALGEYEGTRLPTSATSTQSVQKEAIYRVDALTGAVTKLADEPLKPNGLCFSQDYKRLYVADTGISHYPEAKPTIWVFDVDGAKLANPRTFVSMELNGKTGVCDGLRCDEDGNVWASGDGLATATTAFTSSRRMAPESARSDCLRCAPTSVSAAPSATGCS